MCWAVVKLGGGHNCTTGPEENIGVCRRMGGGGWAGARPGQDAGFIPQTPVLYSQLDLFVLSAHECVQRTHMVSS